jgi:hypothetical protein
MSTTVTPAGAYVPPPAPCKVGYKYDTASKLCVPSSVPACMLGTVLDAKTGTCVPLVNPGAPVLSGQGNVCGFGAPFQCSAAQWVQYQGVTPAQFLAMDTVGCALGTQGGFLSSW